MGWTVQLLGGVSLASDGSPRPVGGTNQKVLVASLALRPGKVVTTERLIDLVWGDEPPRGARRTLQASVSKLRAALGPGCPITADAGGYRLGLDRSDVDLLRVEDLAEQAFELAELDPVAASARLADLVEMWEEPLAGLSVSNGVAALLAPFHELHRQVVARRCSTSIDAGEPAAAVRLLEVLTRNDPTNEKLWYELGRGLVALGRRHEALDAIQRAREALRDELGVDLGPQLARLELEILDGIAPEAVVAPAAHLRTDNLRPEPDEFVARQEVDRLWSMLAAGAVVSVVGPGGIGKTRCAQAVGRRAVDEGRWSDGVWLVDLTSLPSDAVDIAAAVSIAIGAGRQGGAATSGSVADYLRDRQVLLILDNCEHVRAATQAFVAELLARRSTVAVLATSRIRLGAATERTVTLGPLPLSAACQLFAARASEIGAGTFAVETVEELCVALDCYPLAIELAAARTRALSAQEIVDRLDRHPALGHRRLPLDQGRPASTTAPNARHDTLDAALDWSLAQLTPRTRSTLDRLAVFTGDFDLGAAEAIVATDDLSGAALLDDLGLLVEHHLLVRDHARGRYRVLEPIRQTLLAQAHLDDDIRRRHGEHFVREASVIGAGVFGGDEARCWDRFEAERTNLRDAVRWAAEAAAPDALETAMTSMALVVLEGGDVGPGEWAEDALRRVAVPHVDVPCTALAAAAGWALEMRFDDCDRVLDALDRSLTDPRLRAIMYVVRFHRSPGEASRWSGSMLDAAVEADDPVLIAVAKVRGLHPDAMAVADEHGSAAIRSTARVYSYALLPSLDQPRSLHLVDEAYRLALASNNQLAMIQALVVRGTSSSRAGDVARGAPCLLEALERALRRRSPQLTWTVIEAIANLLVVMRREPAVSAMLWSAVDSTDIAPYTRVVRHAELPDLVRDRLSAIDWEQARATGRTLSMDEAARAARKAVERFADD